MTDEEFLQLAVFTAFFPLACAVVAGFIQLYIESKWRP